MIPELAPEGRDLPAGGIEALNEYRRLLDELRKDYQNASRHLELGRFYLRYGHRGRAYSAFRAAKALQPNLEGAYRWLGKLYHEDGEIQRARDTYLQLLSYRPDLASVHLALGQVYRELDDLPRAVSALGQAAKLDPDSVEAFRLLAEIALDAGEIDRAVGYLNHLKALTPSDPRIFVLSARAQIGRQAPDRAILDYRQAISLAPADPDPRLELAGLYLTEGLPGQTLEVLAPQLAGEDPGVEVLLAASEARAQLSEIAEAEALLVRLSRLHPEEPRAPLRRARLRAEDGDLAGAEEQFRRAATLTPTDPAPMLELVAHLVEARRLESARAVLEELAAAFPAQAEVHLRRARLEAREGVDEAALAAFGRAIELEPGSAGPRRERARVLLHAGRLDEALVDLERAREIDPEGTSEAAEQELLRNHESYREAFRRHGEVTDSLARGDYRAAHAQLVEIVRLVPDNPRWLSDLADVARVVGEFDEALRRLGDLHALDPENTAALRARGDLAYRLDRWPEAAEAYEALAERNPSDVSSRLRVLRTLRHKLVERQIPPDCFQVLERAYRDNLEDEEGRDLARLELSLLYLGMGSHLYEPKVWVSAVESHLAPVRSSRDRSLRALAGLVRLELMRVTDDTAGLEKAAEDWVAAEPEDPDAAWVHLEVLERRGKPRAGRDAAERYLERFPDDGRLHDQACRFLLLELEGVDSRDARLVEHVRELQRRAAAQPRDADGFLRLGFAHLHLGSREQRTESLSLASAAFRKAADLDGSSVWPWWGGVLVARAGIEVARGAATAAERARAAAQAAVRRFPRDPWLLFQLGELLVGDTTDPAARAQGQKALERCVVQGPRPFAPAHALLGRLAEARGDRNEAYHHFLKVFEEPEGVGEDRDVLARLRNLVTR